jgi:hypothetical protein
VGSRESIGGEASCSRVSTNGLEKSKSRVCVGGAVRGLCVPIDEGTFSSERVWIISLYTISILITLWHDAAWRFG